MRSPSKRSRSKSNRPKPLGNIVNRVFDSSGPEGKVRGTPQQIIDKYLTLARDAQLSGDRVASENFLQHGEHYVRMLNDAQREMAREAEARREQQGQNGQQQGGRRNEAQQDKQQDGANGVAGRSDQGSEPGQHGAPQADGQREAQAEARGDARGDAPGDARGDVRAERRAAGRNRRRDQTPREQDQPDHASAERRDGGRDSDVVAAFGAAGALGDDGGAALVDTPEGRDRNQRGRDHASAAAMEAETGQGRNAPAGSDTAATDAADAVSTDGKGHDDGPRFVTGARSGADDSAGPEADAAGADDTGVPRRKPAARKPRASTAARRTPRSSEKDSESASAASAEGNSNAAE